MGTLLWQGLKDTYELYGVDIRLREQTQTLFRADISDPEQVNAVFNGIPGLEYVVHLAADPHVDANWQSVLANNIVGIKNVHESAKTHRVKRLVFASSNHVTGAY